MKIIARITCICLAVFAFYSFAGQNTGIVKEIRCGSWHGAQTVLIYLDNSPTEFNMTPANVGGIENFKFMQGMLLSSSVNGNQIYIESTADNFTVLNIRFLKQ